MGLIADRLALRRARRQRPAEPFDGWTKAQLWVRVQALESKLNRARRRLDLEARRGEPEDRNEIREVLTATEFREARLGPRAPR